MKVLLDTQAALYAFGKTRRLPYAWRAVLEPTANRCFLSTASLWEIAIKARGNRADFNADARTIHAQCLANDITILDIGPEIAIAAGRLPLHHKDPFDRAIIAQATALGASVMTTDSMFARYNVALVPA